MSEIYLHIVARMADYMATHPYICKLIHSSAVQTNDKTTKPDLGQNRHREQYMHGESDRLPERVRSVALAAADIRP